MALLSGRRDAFFQSLMWVLIAHVKWLLVHSLLTDCSRKYFTNVYWRTTISYLASDHMFEGQTS